MLLAIDTATTLLSIALHDGEALAAEYTLLADRRHSALLAPLIEGMLAQARVDAGDLTALAVSVGPGSYTGVRIGVALAKGMAGPRELPLVPATTLETVVSAQAARDDDLPLVATVAAGRERVIWAAYERDGDNWIERGAPQISDWAGMLATNPGSIRVSGEISPAGLDAIRQAQATGRSIHLPRPAERLRRAGFLAEMAWRRLREEGANAFPADRVAPIYLRSP